MWPFNSSHLPFANGPYIPGCVDVMTEYSKDGLFFRIYYPTNKTGKIEDYKSDWIPWVPHKSYMYGFARVVMVWVIIVRFIIWLVSGNIQVPVVYGAKIKNDKKLKCLVFSHGLGGGRFLYSSICNELASRGFLIACIEHRDDSSGNTYYYDSIENAKCDKKTYINFVPHKFGNNHYIIRNAQVTKRSEECQQLIDLLINVNSGKVPHNIFNDIKAQNQTEFDLKDLVDALDVDDISVVGHSFGGATALLTLAKNPKLKRGIILDAWMFPIKDMPELITNGKQPLIFINTQTFHIPTNVKVMEEFSNADPDKRPVYTILHTTHENQTDTVFVSGYWLNWFMKKLSAATAIDINNALILQFLKNEINSTEDITDCEEYLLKETENIVTGIPALENLIKC